MNIKALQWLLAHRDLLLKIVDVAKGFSRHKPYLEQWDVVDKIARLVIPVLAADEMKPQQLVYDDVTKWETFEDLEIAAFSAGADVAAMGVDWKMLVEVILPLVIAILQALAAKKDQ